MARSGPGWRDLRDDLRARIESGAWAPGAAIPNEADLAETFGVARATVSRALRDLSEGGLLDRRRKAGSRVRTAPLRQARFDIPVPRAEIEATGAQYRHAVLRRERIAAPDPVRARLGLPPAAEALHLLCLHLADGAPFQLEDRWINLQTLPEAETADLDSLSPTEWLIAAVPYSEVEISFLASAADADIADHLGMRIGDPVFTIERTTWWQGRSVTHVRMYCGAGYRMTTRY
jgi:GntR family histidine utilization transcriptional repressor